MKCIIDSQVVLLRAPEGPLAAYVKPFAGSLREQGYAQDSIQRQVMLAACFSQWLNNQGVALRSVTSEHPPRYLRYRARRVLPSHGDAAALSHLLTFLRGEGVIPADATPRPVTPTERWTRAYEVYLRDVRGLAIATIVNYVPFVARFLKDCFGERPPCTLRSLRQ